MSESSNQTTQLEVQTAPDIFHLLDSEDEKQIIAEAQGRLKEALVYTTKKWNKDTKQMEEVDQLSYTGIQHITIMMAQQRDTVGSLAIDGEPEIKMETIKYNVGEEEKTIQKWCCKLNVINTLTKMRTPGYAEADVVVYGDKIHPQTGKKIWNDSLNSYEKELVYDDFGKNKALSKAFRNACKVQIPQSLILEMIRIAKTEGRVKHMDEPKQTEQSTEKPEPKPVETVSYCTCDPEKCNPSEDVIKESDTNKKSLVGLLSCRRCSSPISQIRTQAIIAKRSSS